MKDIAFYVNNILCNHFQDFPRSDIPVILLLLSKAIKPQSYNIQDVLFELKKHRLEFQHQFAEYLDQGNFLSEKNDIIVKDVKRIDKRYIELIDSTNLSFNFDMRILQKYIEVLIRMYDRYELSLQQDMHYEVAYLQGMHDFAAFILHIFVDAASKQYGQTVNPLVATDLLEVLSDTFLLLKQTLNYLLDFFIDHRKLGELSSRVHDHMMAAIPDFNNKFAGIPDFIVFTQKSLKLLFIRDFNIMQAKQIWLQIFAYQQCQLPIGDFISFLSHRTYLWRYKHLRFDMNLLVFLEDCQLFPEGQDFDKFCEENLEAFNELKHLKVKCMKQKEQHEHIVDVKQLSVLYHQQHEISVISYFAIQQLTQIISQLEEKPITQQNVQSSLAKLQQVKHASEGYISITPKQGEFVESNVMRFDDIVSKLKNYQRLWQIFE